MDALTMEEVGEIAQHWSEEPSVAACVRAWVGVKPPEALPRQIADDLPLGGDLTREQYEELVAGMKANAERYGRRKPHG